MDPFPEATFPVLSSGFIPKEPEEISAPWLFEVINQYRKSKELSLLRSATDIIECEINERITSKGFLSSTYSILCRFKVNTMTGRQEVDYSMFVKLMTSSQIKNSDQGIFLTKWSGAFKREIEANFRLLKELNRFVAEAGRSRILVPEVVYGAHDEEGNGVAVWMDAASTLGFRPTAHFLGLAMDRLVSSVHWLAEFHAGATAFLLKKGPKSFSKEFPNLAKGPGNPAALNETALAPVAQVYRDFARFIRRIPGRTEAFKAFEQIRQEAPLILSFLQGKSSEAPFQTVIHGELWEKNLLFRSRPDIDSAKLGSFEGVRKKPQYSPDIRRPCSGNDDEEDDEDFGEVTSKKFNDVIKHEVMWTDWKNCRIGSPAQDLAMLLLSSASLGTRAKFGDQLVRLYFDSFVRNLKDGFGLDLVALHPAKCTFEHFLDEFEDCLFTAFLKLAQIMTVELKNLESDFLYIKDDKAEDKLKAGLDLRAFGRRMLDVIDDFVPTKIRAERWKNLVSKAQSGASNPVLPISKLTVEGEASLTLRIQK